MATDKRRSRPEAARAVDENTELVQTRLSAHAKELLKERARREGRSEAAMVRVVLLRFLGILPEEATP